MPDNIVQLNEDLIKPVADHVQGATGIKQVRNPVSTSAQAGALGMCSCFCSTYKFGQTADNTVQLYQLS